MKYSHLYSLLTVSLSLLTWHVDLLVKLVDNRSRVGRATFKFRTRGSTNQSPFALNYNFNINIKTQRLIVISLLKQSEPIISKPALNNRTPVECTDVWPLQFWPDTEWLFLDPGGGALCWFWRARNVRIFSARRFVLQLAFALQISYLMDIYPVSPIIYMRYMRICLSSSH